MLLKVLRQLIKQIVSPPGRGIFPKICKMEASGRKVGDEVC